jgi:hypothetical protein
MVAVKIILTFYFYATQIVKPMFALELDPTKDTTDISRILLEI